MSSNRPHKNQTQRARALRASTTKSEKVLWSLLRAKQLSNLKFHRQFSIPQFIVVFACRSRKLIVEVDGGYHDFVVSEDLQRENYLRSAGWDVLRFSDQDVLTDVEAVGRVITEYVGVEYYLARRDGGGSGYSVD